LFASGANAFFFFFFCCFVRILRDDLSGGSLELTHAERCASSQSVVENVLLYRNVFCVSV
jgi:hypothetical protein